MKYCTHFPGKNFSFPQEFLGAIFANKYQDVTTPSMPQPKLRVGAALGEPLFRCSPLLLLCCSKDATGCR